MPTSHPQKPNQLKISQRANKGRTHSLRKYPDPPSIRQQAINSIPEHPITPQLNKDVR